MTLRGLSTLLILIDIYKNKWWFSGKCCSSQESNIYVIVPVGKLAVDSAAERHCHYDVRQNNQQYNGE